MKENKLKQLKTVDFKDYDKSKYKSCLQQKYAQLYGQEILLECETEAFSSSESPSSKKEN